MAKKRPEPEKSVDTEEESGQEEEDASSDVDGGSDSEPEPTQFSKKPPKKPEPSSEESDSESEADSDSNPKAATTPTKKPRSKPAAAAKPTPPTKSAAGTKRPAAANGEAKESKKSKKKPSGEVKQSATEDSKNKAVAKTEDPKKQLFQRLWSEKDETAVLKGMIEYAEEKNDDPVVDLNAFHDYIRESLQIDASRAQLQDKIRRLRKKYENNSRKEKKGKERTFSKRHDQYAYDLSKLIWGGGHKASAAQNGSGVVKAGESSKLANNNVEVDEEKNVDMNVEGLKSLNSIGGSLFGKSLDELSEWIEKKKGWVSDEESIEMEEKWKALKIAEVELFLKRAKLMYDQGKLVLDALKKK